MTTDFHVDNLVVTTINDSTPLVNPATTKGDLLVDTGSALARLGVGSNGQVLTARSSATNGVDWEAGGGGSPVGWVVPTGFTDTEMAVAVAAVNATTGGCVLYLPPGNYVLANTYSFTKPVTVIGCGCADQLMNAAITTISFSGGATDCFDFTVDPFQVRDVHFKNTSGSTPTAGSAIHSTGHNGGHKLTNVTVQGFYDNIVIDNQGEWSWVSVTTYGWVHWGARIQNLISVDGGDQAMVNCFAISATYNSAASFRWESGGGLRITNLKINERGGFTAAIGIDVAIAASAVTSDFLLSNSSIENVSAQPIKIRNGSGATLKNIAISNVQFANYGSAVPAVDIVATVTGTFDRVALDNLVFSEGSSSVSAINVQAVDNVAVGLCVQGGHPSLVSLTTVTNFRNDNARLGTQQIATTSGSIPVDCTNAESFNLSLSGNGTLALPTNAASGVMGNIRIHGNAHTLALAAGWKCPGGAAPTLSASNFDIWSFQYDGFDGTFALVATQNFA